MPEQNNGKRRWGRRLGLGIAALVHIDFFYFMAITRNVDIDWFQIPATIVLGICLFVGGYLTATDLWGKVK